MSYPNHAQSEYLENSRVLFDNLAVRPDMLTVLEDYGYPGPRIFEGKQLFIDSDKLFKDFYSETQKRDSLFKEKSDLFDGVKLEYTNYVNRLRPELIFDPATKARLGLNGRREVSNTSVVGQAINFYGTVVDNPDVLLKLETYGVTLAKMQDALARIAGYQQKLSEYKHSKGECQRLRVERDKMIQRLKYWINAFVANCKVAFAENLQTLEVVGYFVRNQKKNTTNTNLPDPSEPPETPEDPESPEINETGTPGVTEPAPSTGAAE